MATANRVAADCSPYSALGDLETMRHAQNYNASLLQLILDHGTSPLIDFGAGMGTHAEMCRERGLEVACVEPDPTFRRSLEERGVRAMGSLDEAGSNSVPFA